MIIAYPIMVSMTITNVSLLDRLKTLVACLLLLCYINSMEENAL